MNKFSLDYEHLDQRVNAQKVYRLADVQHRIEKVAFDVVRFVDDDDSTRLWQVQDTPDGPVIVAMYGHEGAAEPAISVELKSESTEWKAVPDKQAGVHIFHKGEAIVRLAAADFGIPETEIGTLCRWLPKKLATDEELRGMVFKMAQPAMQAKTYTGQPVGAQLPAGPQAAKVVDVPEYIKMSLTPEAQGVMQEIMEFIMSKVKDMDPEARYAVMTEVGRKLEDIEELRMDQEWTEATEGAGAPEGTEGGEGE